MSYVIGFDVGGTKCAVTLGITVENASPEILEKTKFPTKADKPYTVL